jgi:acyl-CoA hydrolase
MVEIYLTATAATTTGMDVRIAVTVKDRPGGKGQATAEKSLK